MTVPVTLKDWFDGARSMVRRATWFDANQLVGNAVAHVETVKHYVVSTGPIERAYRDVLVHAGDFREVITREGLPSDRNTASIEQARELALLAFDRLDVALTDARPNDMARAMGMDWL